MDGTKIPRRESDLKFEGRIFTNGMAKNGIVQPGSGGLRTTEYNMIDIYVYNVAVGWNYESCKFVCTRFLLYDYTR